MSFYRVRTVHTGLAGAPYLSTHNFAQDDVADPDDLIGLVATFWTQLAAGIKTTNVATVQSVIQLVSEVDGEIIGEDTGTSVGIPGTASGTAEWSAKQGLMALRTATFVRGRRLQGRLFVPGVEAGSGEQVPIAGYTARLVTAGNGLISNSAINSTPWSVVQRPRESPATIGTMAPITSVIGRPYWAVLRSRRD